MNFRWIIAQNENGRIKNFLKYVNIMICESEYFFKRYEKYYPQRGCLKNWTIFVESYEIATFSPFLTTENSVS